jgi:hypothetical protein
MNTEIIHRLQRTFALDDSGAATNMLDWLRNLGVEVTSKAKEQDVAVALQMLFGRWFQAGLPGVVPAGTKPPTASDREKK